MTRSIKSLLAFAGLMTAVAALPVAVKAADAAAAPASAIAPFSTITSLDLVSKYVWRGIPERGTGPSVQPSFTLAYDAGSLGSLSGNWWGDWDTRNAHGDTMRNRFSEHDFTFTWAKTFENKLTLTAGSYSWYLPRQTPRQDTEVFGTVSYGGWWVVPTVAVYYGTRAENGWYGNLNLAHTFDLKDWLDGLSFTSSISQGVATSNWEMANTGVHKNGLHDFGAKETLSYAITSHLSTSIYAAFSALDGKQVRDAAKAGRDTNANNLIGGVNLTFAY